MKTPVTLEGLVKYDHLPPAEAALKAWTTPGINPPWDAYCKHVVRNALPLLARALDRLAKEEEAALRTQIAADIRDEMNRPERIEMADRYEGYFQGQRSGLETAARIAEEGATK